MSDIHRKRHRRVRRDHDRSAARAHRPIPGPDRVARGHPGDDQHLCRVERRSPVDHVDVERAKKESPFGTTIAHGNLTSR